jgi:F-type H+-transporting ATPase subunit alpha
MNSEKTDLMNSINETGDYNKDIEAKLKDALTAFKSTQTW